MTVILDDDKLRADITRIVESDDRQPLINDLVTYLVKVEMIEVWSRDLANRLGRPNDAEEFGQVSSQAIIERLLSIEPDEVGAIASVASHLFFVCKRAVTVYIDSPAVTVAGGMSGASRRYREAQKHRHTFQQEKGYEPTDQELADYINAKVTATRANAVKQGAIVTAADVSGFMLKPYSMDYRPSSDDGEVGDTIAGAPDDGGVDHAAMVAITVRQLEALAAQMYDTDDEPPLQDVLHAWMAFVSAGERPTAVGIAAQFGITRARATVLTKKLETVLEAFRSR